MIPHLTIAYPTLYTGADPKNFGEEDVILNQFVL